MKTKKPAGPSPEEVAAQRAAQEETSRLNQAQLRLIERQNANIEAEKVKADADAAEQKRASSRTEEARMRNRVGMRSLLSGDWQGFRRGGDLGVG